ncbi:ATPase, partial [Gardnerella vaginalis]
TFQVAIDHKFKNANMTLILCGSNEGFMESEVLGKKSPLYGRRTAQIRLQPFNLFEASELMPNNATWEDKINYFASLGGTPYYIEQLDNKSSFAENLEQLCFNISGILYAEPDMLMRQELRDPSTYNSVLNALATGCNTPTLISDRIGLPATSVNVYLKTLEGLGLIERNIPFGMNPLHCKKGLWQICDPFFAYWYRFVAPNKGLIE